MVIDKKYIDNFTFATERAAYGASLFSGKKEIRHEEKNNFSEG